MSIEYSQENSNYFCRIAIKPLLTGYCIHSSTKNSGLRFVTSVATATIIELLQPGYQRVMKRKARWEDDSKRPGHY